MALNKIYTFQDYYKVIESYEFEEMLAYFNNHQEFIANKKNDYENNNLEILKIEWDESSKSYLLLIDDITENLTFKMEIEKRLKPHYSNFKNVIREFTLPPLKTTNRAVIKHLQSLLNELIKISSSKNSAISIPLNDHLKKIQSYLNNALTGKLSRFTDSHQTLDWIGNLNQLTTLFIKLQTGDNNLKKKFLSGDFHDLKKLILTNFTHKGQPISEITLSTYFGKIRYKEDLAKNPLELPEE